MKAALGGMFQRQNAKNRVPEDECSSCRGSGWKIVPRLVGGIWTECAEKCVCQTRKAMQIVVRNLPVAMQTMTLENFDFSRVQPRKVFDDLLTQPNAGYLLDGPYGVGKTHLLVGLYMRTAVLSGNALLLSSRELMVQLTDEAKFLKTPVMTLAKSRGPFHLFWDDIDKVKETETRRELLFHLLDSMYVNDHRISATANTQLKDLEKTNIISGALMRRIDEMIKFQVALVAK